MVRTALRSQAGRTTKIMKHPAVWHSTKRLKGMLIVSVINSSRVCHPKIKRPTIVNPHSKLFLTKFLMKLLILHMFNILTTVIDLVKSLMFVQIKAISNTFWSNILTPVIELVNHLMHVLFEGHFIMYIYFIEKFYKFWWVNSFKFLL